MVTILSELEDILKMHRQYCCRYIRDRKGMFCKSRIVIKIRQNIFKKRNCTSQIFNKFSLFASSLFENFSVSPIFINMLRKQASTPQIVYLLNFSFDGDKSSENKF